MGFVTRNPASGEVLREYSFEYDFEPLAARSFESFKAWRSLSVEFRCKKILGFKTQLELHREELGQLISREMGKPIREARAEVSKSMGLCDYVYQTAPRILSDQVVETTASKSYLSHRPLGPILGIMPWNFPLWQVVRFALPALAAGNTVILKPAESVAGTAKKIQNIFEEAGFGAGVFETVFLDNDTTGKLIRDSRIRGVSLTGSVGAGRAVGSIAGQALKKCVLELGGSDPYIVLKDADVALAAAECVRGRFINGGQSCIAAKRFLVVESIHDEFLAEVKQLISELRVGDPAHDSTEIGPMARADLRDQLHDQVKRTVAMGAKIVLGGQPLSGAGNFYAPTLLIDVPSDSPAMKDEMFGPVAVIKRVRDEAEAIEVANATEFGLGAAVFTKNTAHGERLAREFLDVGMGFVNEFVKSTPLLPFGGVKASGLGRELGPQGFLEFVNVRSVWVR